MDTRIKAAVAGIVAPALYMLTVVLGGNLWPEYSHLRDPISLLASKGAPQSLLINVLFAVYDVLLSLFGFLWWSCARNSARPGRSAGLYLVVIGGLGIAMFAFPQDMPGSPVSIAGAVHIGLAAAMSLLTMITILVRGRAEMRLPAKRGAALYSFVSLGIVFVAGAFAGIGVAHHWAIAGLLERCTIGTFLFWVMAEAWTVSKRAI
jgi:hypothetical membrane protein